MWPCQRFDISVNRVDKNITIEYDSSSKQWYMIVPPSANASEDYDVNIIQHTIKGTDFPTFAKVRVKTFDYNYTFKDENGNVIKRLTADYGQTVTAPDDTHTWVCDEYSNWQNTKDGPQDRVVYATQASEEFRKTVASARKLTVGNFKVEAKNNRMAAVSWKKNRDADGYQIWYSTDKKFKQSVKSIKIDKSNAKELLKKLKPGKKLYVKITAYKRIKYPGSGKKITVYGEWSKVKSFKVK